MAKETGTCRIAGCDGPDMGNGYCRRHYIQHWKAIKSMKSRADRVRLRRLREAVIRDLIEGTDQSWSQKVKKEERIDDDTFAEIADKFPGSSA
ncbi:MAG: hypothetical protein H6683_02335 [Deltaproteobacteria bacterium]|nr:hypothetical protein [Deltaproteobacteria bacterium]MCB9478495.1 hypothetical protein [Deltaproteobacteria bacterium]